MDNSEHFRRIVSNYFRQYDRNTAADQREDIFTIFSSSMYPHNRKVCVHNGSVSPTEKPSTSASSSQDQPSTSRGRPFTGPSTSAAADILDSEMPARRYDVDSLERTRSRRQQQYEPCHACNGYYGPRYEDPYCAVCHAFLYPNMTSSVEVTSQIGQSSDSDSGNDEPVDNNTYPRSSSSRSYLAKNLFASSSTDADSSSSSRDRSGNDNVVPQNMGTLAEELQRLSTPFHTTGTSIEMLPTEVLIFMLRYLDEIALWSFGQVCFGWKEILLMYVKPDQWRTFFRNRWPLYPRAGFEHVSDWYELYTSMMHSSCCMKCVRQMAAQALPPNWEENQWRKHRLRSELRAMRNDPLDGIETVPLDNSYCHWQATIHGPAGSPYEGGLFFLHIQVPASYPLYPPVVRFLTKVYHPNISRHGDIGIDSIHHNWSLVFTLSKLLISIQSLLTDPYCEVCMEPEIAQIYLNDRERFNEIAQMWTFSYAMHDLRST